MGICHGKSDKIDKNHNRRKMLKFGVSFGCNDLIWKVICKWGTDFRHVRLQGVKKKGSRQTLGFIS